MVKPPYITGSDGSRILEDPVVRAAQTLAREHERFIGLPPGSGRTAAEEALGLSASAIARGLPKTALDAISATRLAAAGLDPVTKAMRDAEARLPPGIAATMRKAQEHFELLSGTGPIGAGLGAIDAATWAADAYRSPAREVLDEIAGERRGSPPRGPGGRIADRAIRAGPGGAGSKGKEAAAGPAVASGAAIASTADIGRRIRAARRAMGMTQQRFADLAGVGRRFLGELERGKESLEIGRVLAVCAAAGIKLGFVA